MYLCNRVKEHVYQLDFLAMQEDLENEIERKKKEIEDFLRIVKFTGLSQKEIEKDLIIS